MRYRCQYPHLQVRRSAIHGRGLFPRAPIRAGTRIGEYRGERTTRNGAYVLWIQEDGTVYGIIGRNELRFMNHSASPNAWFDGPVLYALRLIEPGEEITLDYGEDWR